MEIQAAIVLVLVFFLMLAMSVPVSFSIISASLLTIIMFLTPGFGMFVSAQKIVSGIDSFTLLAVPFFVLAGLLMSSGGIAKRLTTHVARHTAATVVFLANDVSMENVSKILGHSNIRMTQHYARVMDRNLKDNMNIVRSKMGL